MTYRRYYPGLILDDHEFTTPTKMVKKKEDMKRWEASPAYKDIFEFICNVNNYIRGKTNSMGSEDASECVDKIYSMLDTLDEWIDEIPPVKDKRFSTEAYRDWHARLQREAVLLIADMLPHYLFRALLEIEKYFVNAFGNSNRIYYGTEHELTFIMFLLALFKIGYLDIDDLVPAACKIFVRYLHLVRKLQVTYNMETAGCRGFWRLDDYQFVPFIWGSSQFIKNDSWDPTCFLKQKIVDEYAYDYMFLSCVQYINIVKSGQFIQHSYPLWSISAVSSWTNINEGLLKMYKDEVLSRFPLVQHIYFGSLFTLDPLPNRVIPRRKTSFYELNQLPSNMNYCDPDSSDFSTSIEISSAESGPSLIDPTTSETYKEIEEFDFTLRLPSDANISKTNSKISNDLKSNKRDDKNLDIESSTKD
ncbi:serine/threonine-protein phosphatase 2A activator-like [Diorhabda carinulata]|uniref:serine/threonine-protein phosphatase 2A activator-like n=1 Tax=Diorhabda carinulata TaxID=1163345 RepID=UPI0025A16C51|nr:serine/threonine-protein phosphatase 2A activator-like [Diorhabda carinulata]